MQEIEHKVEKFINQNALLAGKTKILLAISGGTDSVALLNILISLKNLNRINNNFYIAHINHQLRGEKSLEDENFVKNLAENYKLPITISRIDVRKYANTKKLSIETAARQLRLEKLIEIAKKNECDAIATAHQKNDNAETIIHRLLRGTGFKGLAGIRPRSIINGTVFIRPLLCLTRKEIEDYLALHNLHCQLDHTNLDCRYTRNRIRYKLLPALQEQNKNDLIELLFRLSMKSFALADKIERQAEQALQQCLISESEDAITMDKEKFNRLFSLLKIEIIQAILQNHGIGLQKFTAKHYEKILEFLKENRTGKTLQLPNKVYIRKEQKSFQLFFKPLTKDNLPAIQLNIPGKTLFGNWIIEAKITAADKLEIENFKKNKDKFTERFDLAKVKQPLTARNRQIGDRFIPIGMKNPKKVGKLITSEKIEPYLKENAFVICDAEKIIWLAPVRRSNEALLTKGTNNILELKIRQYKSDI